MANEALRLIGGTTETRPEAASDEVNLRELWRALMRRKFALLAPVALITLGMFFLAKQQPPMYTAEALLHVKTRDAQVIEVEGVVEEMIADPATIESEIEYLSSPAFSRRIVEKLGLTNDPEFAPWLRESEPDPIGTALQLLNPMRYIPEEWLQFGDAPQQAAQQLDQETRQLNSVTRRVAGRLTVEQVGRSYVIALQFLSEDPAKAATIANAMTEEYLASQVEAKYAARRIG